MIRVDVFALNKRFRRLELPVRTAAEKLIRLIRLRNCALTVYLAGKSVMNKNVLAYPAPKGFPRPDIMEVPLGEIFLNPDYIKKEKLEKLEIRNSKLEIPAKLVYMLAHGFLHLLGYNHKHDRDRIKMERKERELLGKLR